MEITKNKMLAGLVAAAVVLGTTFLTQCPWAKKQWDENVAPLVSGVAPVTTE